MEFRKKNAVENWSLVISALNVVIATGLLTASSCSTCR